MEEWQLSEKDVVLVTDCCSSRCQVEYAMVEGFLEQQPAICATLLFPEIRKGESDLPTFKETDVSNAEDILSALKPMKDATLLMSKESNPTVCLYCSSKCTTPPEHDTIGDLPLVRQVKNAIKTDLCSNIDTVHT